MNKYQFIFSDGEELIIEAENAEDCSNQFKSLNKNGKYENRQFVFTCLTPDNDWTFLLGLFN